MRNSAFRSAFRALFALLCALSAHSAWAQEGAVVIPVNAPAVQFSPGNWVGDAGRGGSQYRQSWCNGAFCTWDWSTTSASPTAMLQISNPTPGAAISYFLDGHLTDNVPVPASGGISILGLSSPGRHILTVFLRDSPQRDRWDEVNAFKVTGLALDSDATPGLAPPARPWVLIIGDSITEGILADNGRDDALDDYSFLVGQGLTRAGYDYGVSACGYSGWLRPGDATHDVPPYYTVTNGVYSDAASRWDKLDARTSLLDRQGHLSAYGGTGQEPSAILINYGTNETLNASPVADVQTSVTQALAALRQAAPHAWLCLFVPFGLENGVIYPHGMAYVQALKAGLRAYQASHPKDKNVTVVDLGASVANALASPPYGGGVHPNAAGHAYLTSQILPMILPHLASP